VASYWIGLSALQAGQRALDVIGQNIANAATPGYHRQRVDLASLIAGNHNGAGVTVASVTRAAADAIRAAINTTTSEASRINARLDSQSQIQDIFTGGSNSIGSQINNFFNQIDQLTAHPDDPTLRRVVLSAATSLASRISSAAADLNRVRTDLRSQVDVTVDSVNKLTSQIADLNTRIVAAETGSTPANDLRDQRDQLVDQLSQLIDIRTATDSHGGLNVIGPGTTLVVGGTATQLQSVAGPNGTVQVTSNMSPTTLPIQGGTLGGLMGEVNTSIPALRGKLDTLATALIQQVNSVQATGLGTSGPQSLTVGTWHVSDPSVPLASAGLPFTVQAGQIEISVTNSSTGQRSNYSISVDPSTDSLTDLANAITTATGGQVQASVDPVTNTLRLQAQSGYAFDFAGRVPSPPEGIAMGGTAIPTVSGTYSGSSNDRYTFNILGTGTIGTTSGLQLQVLNSANNVIATLDVGSGYVPGTSLTIANGISVSLLAGTTTNGTFSVPVTSQPDTTGLLAGLGIGGLFTGGDASSIAVNSAIIADPGLLAISRNGDPSDASNAVRFSALRDATVLDGGLQSFGQYHDALIGEIGNDVKSLDDQSQALGGMKQNLVDREQSEVGVDVNEETVSMLQFQRLIDSSSKYLAVVNATMDSILNIIQ
jgi:flagellar hook-associated protein 1